ncbi:hypothetical protein ACWDR3_31235 [Streptomyces sp. NPDC001002]
MSHAPDPDPGISDVPPPSSSRARPFRRRKAFPLFLLLITVGTVVAATVSPVSVQALAAAVSSLCALWQLVRSGNRDSR